jgi:ABC-type transport system involved in multi-copper enzyme maturation permease subunit
MKSFDAVSAIAINTFRETVRDRIIYAFILFAFAITIMSILLGTLSVGQDVRILEDLGMAAISLIGGIIALFAGINLVFKEMERRTIYLIFTKPVSGWQFILGKYLGLSFCVLLILVAMGGFLTILVAMSHPPHPQTLVFNITESLALVYLELLLVIALATFFSTFASPVMSAIFTLSLWLIGHLSESLKALGQISSSPAFLQFSAVVYAVLPDLAALTKIRATLMYGHQPPAELLTCITCYVLAYVLLLLVLAAWVSERREFF